MASIFTRKGKKGDYRYLSWVDPDTRKRKKEPLGCLISKQVAEAARKRKEAELLMRSTTPRDENQINFREYVHIYLKSFLRRHPSSYETSRYALIEDLEPQLNNSNIPLKDLNLDELTSDDINIFVDITSADGLEASTINRKLGVLTAFLNQAKADGYNVPDIKIKKLPETKSGPPKYYEENVLEKIIKAEKLYPHWWKFLANTGLRAGEFRNLKVEDIKKDGIYIVSSPENRTKSGEWRLIPMNDTIRSTLKDFDMSGEYLIPRFDKDMPKTRFRRLCKKIGVAKGKWGIHCLRHTFASHLVMNGKPLRTVQILMGHANIKTTERYAHLSPDYLKGALEDFGIG
jgi:integrase